MMKRLIALLLAATMLVTLASGCGKKDESGKFTKGDLLTMICDYFGMDTYQSTTPYIESVPASDPYFDVVQACVEWDIIGTDDQKYDVNDKVTRKDLAIALVNAAVLVPDLETATEEDRLASAAVNGIVETNDKGEINGKKKVSYEEAEAAVIKAADLWANKEFTENVQDLELQEGVQDLSGAAAEEVDGQIRIPVSAGPIQTGDAFIYQGLTGLTAAKAEYVREEDGYYIITGSLDDDLELEDVVQELVVQETYAPDLSQAIFVDGAGNVHMPSGASASGVRSSGSEGGAHFLGGAADGVQLYQTEAARAKSINFMFGDVKIEGKYSGDSISLSFKSPTEKDEKGNQTSGVFGELELSNIKLTNDVDYGVFKGLKSLTTRLNYKVKVSGGKSVTWVDKIYAPYNNGNGKFLTNLAQGEWRDIAAPGADSVSGKEIVIGSWSLVEGGIAQVKLELKLNFKITGEVTASLTVSGAQGIEYRGGNIRKIKTTSVDSNLTFKAKAELTAGPGIALKILNKWSVLDLSAKLGASFEASMTIHLVDAEMHQLESVESGDMCVEAFEANPTLVIKSHPDAIYNAALEYAAAHDIKGLPDLEVSDEDVSLHTETCVEIKAEWVAKLEFKPAKFLTKLKVSGFEINLLKKGENEIFKYHVDDFAFLSPVEECTNVFTPFEYYAEEIEEPENASDPTKMDLDTYLMVFNSPDAPPQELTGTWTSDIAIKFDGGTQMAPEFKWSSEDESVATVDEDGVVTPQGFGLTYVTWSLASDPSIYVKCAVYVEVGDYSNSEWEFLPSDMDTSGINGGGSNAGLV